MQLVDLEARISTMDFFSPSLSTSSDDSEEAGSRAPRARDKVNGSVLRRPTLTFCLEGRCKRYRSSTEP